MDRVLAAAAGVHLAVGLAAAATLFAAAPPILGLHPAAKPLKFAFSIALFLATMAVLVPALSARPAVQNAIAWTLSLTMAAEMVPIAAQAMRGTTSHFNSRGPADAIAWGTMFAAIVAFTLAMVVVVLLATARPLLGPDGRPLDPVMAAAWRAGLWLFLTAAVSGFAMGGRGQHSVGGTDGGPGLPVVDWSTRHGDLRVSHFFALHALQVLPLAGAVLTRLPVTPGLRAASLAAVTGVQAGIVLWTLLRALAGRWAW